MNTEQDARTPRHMRELELELAGIWSGVLGVPAPSIDPEANFISLGGDSVSIARVAEQVTARFFPDRPDEAPGIADYFSHGTLRSLAARLVTKLTRPAAWSSAFSEAGDPSVAIVGISCRFPGAVNVEAFWRNLCAGVESIRVFSDDELLQAGVSSMDLLDPRYVKAGAVLEGVRLFDAQYFGMTPREAMLSSPEQRLLLECAEEALQDGGYGDCGRAARVGVFVGTG